jgi:hypothetical protein
MLAEVQELKHMGSLVPTEPHANFTNSIEVPSKLTSLSYIKSTILCILHMMRIQSYIVRLYSDIDENKA